VGGCNQSRSLLVLLGTTGIVKYSLAAVHLNQNALLKPSYLTADTLGSNMGRAARRDVCNTRVIAFLPTTGLPFRGRTASTELRMNIEKLDRSFSNFNFQFRHADPALTPVVCTSL
jgi:hypothetical protein